MANKKQKSSILNNHSPICNGRGWDTGAWGNAPVDDSGALPQAPFLLIRDADACDQRVVHADVVARDAGDFHVSIEDIADLELV